MNDHPPLWHRVPFLVWLARATAHRQHRKAVRAQIQWGMDYITSTYGPGQPGE